MRPKLTVSERFWQGVDRSNADSCWPWTRSTSNYGYGKMWANGQLVNTHRLSWILHVGPIPAGMSVCHHCDNPPCVRPDHLFLASVAGNLTDMSRKGRRSDGVPHSSVMREAAQRGEQHHRAKVTDSIVREIRARADRGERVAEIAADLGLQRLHVFKIAHRQSWQHVK